MAVDPRIGYPILIISAISLILVLLTKADQLNTLQKIEDVETNMSQAIKQSIANYGGITLTLGELQNLANSMQKGRELADARGNTTVGCILRVLADIDEDVELLKSKMNISRDSAHDKIHVDINGTHIIYRDGQNVTYTIPPVKTCDQGIRK